MWLWSTWYITVYIFAAFESIKILHFLFDMFKIINLKNVKILTKLFNFINGWLQFVEFLLAKITFTSH